jgi:hypothetical protein
MNGIAGPSSTDTITGGKTLELSEYDKVGILKDLFFKFNFIGS